MQVMNSHFLQILLCDLTGYALYLDTFSVYAGTQPGGDTVAHDPQGYRQQAVWEYGGDEGVDSCNAG